MKKWKEWAGKLSAPTVSLCEIVIGVLLLIDPVAFTSTIIVMLGVIMALLGLLNMIAYFRTAPAEAAGQRKLAKGLSLAAAGLFCMLEPGWFVATFPVLTMLYGVAILALGIVRVQWTVDEIRLRSGKWLWSAASALLALIAAAIILCDPFSSTAVLWIFAGISLIAEAALDIAAMILLRKRVR